MLYSPYGGIVSDLPSRSILLAARAA